jgi:hypothetical protein
MKTPLKTYWVYNTTNLVSATERIQITTATDIFSVTIYRKKWWSFGRWVQVFYFWGFSGSAKEIMIGLNDWLEYYHVKK